MFDRLAGNRRIKEILKRMLASGRVPGAMLFAGADGVGKRQFALELAKALNCLSPVDLEACDRCSSCVRLSQSKFQDHSDDKDKRERLVWSDHPDVALARPFNRILRIPLMREIEREANFRPYEGRARVFLIEEADKLNQHSSNALLKTLEEPPATTHLILLTSRPSSLLPTIRSRTQVLRFAPLEPAEIEAQLLGTKQFSKDDARLLSRAALGSVERALATDVEEFRRQREAVLDILEALAPPGDRARLLRSSEEMNDAKHKDEYVPRLDLLALLIHDVWTIALKAPEDQIINIDLHPRLSLIASRTAGRRAARWLTQIETHRRGLEVNINRKVATDALFLSMAEN